MLSADQGQYDKKKLIKYLVILGLWTLLWKASHGYIVTVLPLFIFSFVAQRKPAEMFLCVLMLLIPSVSNSYFFPLNSVVMLVMRGTLVTVSLLLMSRIAGRRVPVFLRPMLGILLYLGWEALISMQGYSPIISHLKLLLFVLVYFAYYAIACAIANAPRANAKQIRTVVLAVCIFFIGGSMVLTRVPSIGQFVALRQTLGGEDAAEVVRSLALGEGVSLFCGMSVQPQALGPIVGMMSTLLFADYVFAIRRKDWIYLGLLLSCPILVYKTSSRTAMGVYLAGMSMVVYLFMQARGVGQRWKGKVLTTVFSLGVFALAALIAVPNVRQSALKFVLKFSGENATSKDLTVANVTSSRQGGIDMTLAGFRKKPLLGNGFQVGWWMEHQRLRGWKSYITAPIEKGVWVTAVLEEGGMIGLVLFAGFLFVAIFTLVKRHAYCGASMLWTFMFSNLGEFSFFSMSYIGGFGWTLIFTGLILDGQRLKKLGLQVFEVPPWQVEK